MRARVGVNRLLLCVFALGALLFAQPTAQAQSLEYPVKANYLVRFAAFVDWQSGAFAGPDSALVLCVVGRDPFGRLLDQAAAGQTARGRRILIRRTATGAGCHIAYAGSGVDAGVMDALARQPHLLVVTDAGQSRRGAVHFVLWQNRVRFAVDQAAAQRAGLTISSRLLSLAVSAREGAS